MYTVAEHLTRGAVYAPEADEVGAGFVLHGVCLIERERKRSVSE
jgi:hypothetical protein